MQYSEKPILALDKESKILLPTSPLLLDDSEYSLHFIDPNSPKILIKDKYITSPNYIKNNTPPLNGGSPSKMLTFPYPAQNPNFYLNASGALSSLLSTSLTSSLPSLSNNNIYNNNNFNNYYAINNKNNNDSDKHKICHGIHYLNQSSENINNYDNFNLIKLQNNMKMKNPKFYGSQSPTINTYLNVVMSPSIRGSRIDSNSCSNTRNFYVNSLMSSSYLLNSPPGSPEKPSPTPKIPTRISNPQAQVRTAGNSKFFGQTTMAKNTTTNGSIRSDCSHLNTTERLRVKRSSQKSKTSTQNGRLNLNSVVHISPTLPQSTNQKARNRTNHNNCDAKSNGSTGALLETTSHTLIGPNNITCALANLSPLRSPSRDLTAKLDNLTVTCNNPNSGNNSDAGHVNIERKFANFETPLGAKKRDPTLYYDFPLPKHVVKDRTSHSYDYLYTPMRSPDPLAFNQITSSLVIPSTFATHSPQKDTSHRSRHLTESTPEILANLESHLLTANRHNIKADAFCSMSPSFSPSLPAKRKNVSHTCSPLSTDSKSTSLYSPMSKNHEDYYYTYWHPPCSRPTSPFDTKSPDYYTHSPPNRNFSPQCIITENNGMTHKTQPQNALKRTSSAEAKNAPQLDLLKQPKYPLKSLQYLDIQIVSQPSQKTNNLNDHPTHLPHRTPKNIVTPRLLVKKSLTDDLSTIKNSNMDKTSIPAGKLKCQLNETRKSFPNTTTDNSNTALTKDLTHSHSFLKRLMKRLKSGVKRNLTSQTYLPNQNTDVFNTSKRLSLTTPVQRRLTLSQGNLSNYPKALRKKKRLQFMSTQNLLLKSRRAKKTTAEITNKQLEKFLRSNKLLVTPQENNFNVAPMDYAKNEELIKRIMGRVSYNEISFEKTEAFRLLSELK